MVGAGPLSQYQIRYGHLNKVDKKKEARTCASARAAWFPGNFWALSEFV